MKALHVTPDVAAEAEGAVTAQKVTAQVIDGATPALAWLRYCELAARFGAKSTACRSFINALAKLAAAARSA